MCGCSQCCFSGSQVGLHGSLTVNNTWAKKREAGSAERLVELRDGPRGVHCRPGRCCGHGREALLMDDHHRGRNQTDILDFMRFLSLKKGRKRMKESFVFRGMLANATRLLQVFGFYQPRFYDKDLCQSGIGLLQNKSQITDSICFPCASLSIHLFIRHLSLSLSLELLWRRLTISLSLSHSLTRPPTLPAEKQSRPCKQMKTS